MCDVLSRITVEWLQKNVLAIFFSVSCSAWHCGYGSGGSVWFQVTHSCVGGLVASSGGSAHLSEMPPPITHTLTPCKSSQCFLMAHNEIHLTCLFTRLLKHLLCINRVPIHNIRSDVFINLPTDRDVDICSKLWEKFSCS